MQISYVNVMRFQDWCQKGSKKSLDCENSRNIEFYNKFPMMIILSFFENTGSDKVDNKPSFLSEFQTMAPLKHIDIFLKLVLTTGILRRTCCLVLCLWTSELYIKKLSNICGINPLHHLNINLPVKYLFISTTLIIPRSSKRGSVWFLGLTWQMMRIIFFCSTISFLQIWPIIYNILVLIA